MNPRRQSNFSTARMSPSVPSWIRSRKRQPLIAVVLRNRDDEPQVRLDHPLFGDVISALDLLCQRHLLSRRQQRMPRRLAQEELERVGRRLERDWGVDRPRRLVVCRGRRSPRSRASRAPGRSTRSRADRAGAVRAPRSVARRAPGRVPRRSRRARRAPRSRAAAPHRRSRGRPRPIAQPAGMRAHDKQRYVESRESHSPAPSDLKPSPSPHPRKERPTVPHESVATVFTSRPGPESPSRRKMRHFRDSRACARQHRPSSLPTAPSTERR